MNKHWSILLAPFVCLASSVALASPPTAVFYVDAANGNDANAGDSWASAKAKIGSGISAAKIAGGGIVRVAGGNYRERPYISSASGIEVVGGYPPGGGGRDLARHRTVVDGGIDVIGSSDITMDGLILYRGYGAYYFDPFLWIDSNVGGGISVIDSTGVVLRNSEVLGSNVYGYSFDMDYDPYCYCCDPFFMSAYGAGLFAAGTTDLLVENNLFAGNHLDYMDDYECSGFAYAYGSGIYVANDCIDPVIRFNTITQNTEYNSSGSSAGVVMATVVTTGTEVSHNISYGNDSSDYQSWNGVMLTHSVVGSGGGGLDPTVIVGNPDFVSGAHGNYSLSQIAAGDSVDSPCVDAGQGTAASFGLDTMTTRRDGVPDQGAVDYGFHAPVSVELTLYVTRDGDLSWNDNGIGPWDAIRADRSNVTDAGTHIDLGPVLCLAAGDTARVVTDLDDPPLGDVFFYSVRSAGGSYGYTAGREHLPTSGDCP